MKYVIQLPAVSGDTFPLVAVAEAKARWRATAGNTAFHRPTYDGSFRRYGEDLLAEARVGSLRVCNQWGVTGVAGDIIAAAERSTNMAVFDRTGTEVDHTHTHLCALWVSVTSLNEWAASHGDNFVIASAGVAWIDERGVQVDGPEVSSERTPLVESDAESSVLKAGQGLTAPAPLPLDTGQMAAAFDGLRYQAEAWKKPLGDVPKWLKACRVTAGQRGGAPATWNPVLIGAWLLQAGFVKPRSVRAKFQTVPLLRPWLDAWLTYEQEHIGSD